MNAEKSNGFSQEKLIKWLKNNVMYLVLLLMLVFFATQHKNFLTWGNLMNIINQSSYQIIVGVGMVFVMLSGGMDLSVGYQMSVVSVLVGIMLTKTAIPIPVVVLLAIIAGILLSLVNGVLVARLKVFPFIITLATSYVYQGVSYMLSNASSYLNFPAGFRAIGQGSIAGVIPNGIVIMVVCVIIGAVILNKTYFGRYVYGLGGNPEAISLAGVSIGRMQLLIYGLAGAFVALGTVVLVSRAGSSSSTMGPGTEFTIIAGGMLGGLRLGGGGGKVSNIVLGVILLTVLSNGMQLMGLKAYPQYVAQGLVLICALALDVYQRNSVIRKAKRVSGSADDPA